MAIEISIREGKKQFLLNGSVKKETCRLTLKGKEMHEVQGPVELKNLSEDRVILSYNQGEIEHHIMLEPEQRWHSSGKVKIWK